MKPDPERAAEQQKAAMSVAQIASAGILSCVVTGLALVMTFVLWGRGQTAAAVGIGVLAVLSGATAAFAILRLRR